MSDLPSSPEPDEAAPIDPLDKDRDPLDAAWALVEAEWQDVERHEQALVIADTLDRLGELGRRYRAVRETGGARAALAEQYSEQVVKRALGRLVASPAGGPRKSRMEWILTGVSVALFAAALWSMLRTFG